MNNKNLKLTVLFLGLQFCIGIAPVMAEENAPEEMIETMVTENETHICDNYGYILLEDGTAEIIGYLEAKEISIIPEELDGIPVTAIGPEAFAWNDALINIEIPSSVTRIGKDAFYYCSSLTHAVLPDNISDIENNLFTGCENLTAVSLSPGNPYWETIDGVLYSKADQRLVCYPSEKADISFKIPQGVEIIGDNAFYFCSNLEEIRIPDSVTDIGDNSFYDCYCLKNIEWSDSVRNIGESAFFGCSSLTDITIPDFVTSIGSYAFMDCKKLTNLILPDSLENLGEAAFSGCRSLTDISIPDSVKIIGDNPFRFCESLASISVSPDNSYLEIIDGVLYCKPEKRLVYCPIDKTGPFPEIPGDIIIIDGYAFESCTITDLVIPDTVTDIRKGAFYGCQNLTKIVLPDSVTNIGEHAFYRCSSLTDIIIPASVNNIGDSVFSGCDNLTVTVSPDSYAQKYCEQNGLAFIYETGTLGEDR